MLPAILNPVLSWLDYVENSTRLISIQHKPAKRTYSWGLGKKKINLTLLLAWLMETFINRSSVNRGSTVLIKNNV